MTGAYKCLLKEFQIRDENYNIDHLDLRQFANKLKQSINADKKLVQKHHMSCPQEDLNQ